MAIPPDQVPKASAALESYCAKVPARVRHLVEHTFRVERDAIVLVSRRPFEKSKEWLSEDVAKFRFFKTRGVWMLYFSDRNSKWHEYEWLAPTKNFEVLLAEVDRDPTCLFWG